MKVMVSVGHPAHVHFFKNLIWNLEDKGHDIKIIARKKEVVINLLDNYGFEYELISSKGDGILKLGLELIKRHYMFFKTIRKNRPDVIIAGFDPSVAQIAKILNRKSIVFADNRPDISKFPPIAPMVIPFASTILTLSSVKYDFGPKEVKINSFKELAYLHPKYFEPKTRLRVLDDLGLSENDEFVVLRFVSHGAYHDLKTKGFNLDAKIELVQALEAHLKVVISSEDPLPPQLQKYQIKIVPEQIHDVLYHTNLLVCDSQTMTTEAAILGTPVVRCNSFVGENDMGNFIELEKKYGLIFNCSDSQQAQNIAIEIAQKPKVKEEWNIKRERILKDKIDITEFMVRLVEDYPVSVKNNQ
ncbi:MAG: hypothetical protein JG777_2519 [Clostridia bacterium]|jgi:hypothetical protein|nr:hypothetical protein [Clostridia bacterium]